MDVEDASGQMVRIALDNARAEQVAQVLRQVFATEMRRTPKGSPLTIAPDAASNAIIAAGEPQILAKVSDAIKQMDVSSG